MLGEARAEDLDDDDDAPAGARQCPACARWFRAPACPVCRPTVDDVERCACGDARAMGHSFNEEMRCNTCRRSYGEHQADPKPCDMAHDFNKLEHCRGCGVSRVQHNRKPAPCRYKGK